MFHSYDRILISCHIYFLESIIEKAEILYFRITYQRTENSISFPKVTQNSSHWTWNRCIAISRTKISQMLCVFVCSENRFSPVCHTVRSTDLVMIFWLASQSAGSQPSASYKCKVITFKKHFFPKEHLMPSSCWNECALK